MAQLLQFIQSARRALNLFKIGNNMAVDPIVAVNVIPTERSDEGSLTSVRDDKQTTNMSYGDILRETLSF